MKGFVFALLCCFSSISEGTGLVLAVENSWPPYSDINGLGISRTKIEQAFSNTDIKVTFLVAPYARAVKLAELGLVDGVFNVTRQPSTEAMLRFGEQPLLQAPASYYYPADSMLDFKSIADVADGTSVAVVLGYEYGVEYEQQRSRFREVRVSSQEQIINLLMKGRVDVGIMFDKVAEYNLQQMQLPSSAIKKGHINHVSDIYVAFNKHNAVVDEAIQKLDKGLLKLK